MVKLNEVDVRAMINTGATTNLVEANLVPRLGLGVCTTSLVLHLDRGIGKPYMVECEYQSSSRLEPSLQTTNNGLDRGNSTMMSMVEEQDQVEE
ncbi:hypothetical protein WN943_029251 [Citrus x changshan-huyou]